MNEKEQTTRLVLQRCHELGFALAGVAAAGPTRYEPQLRQWLEQGKHGQMRYLAEHIAQRIDPRNMVAGAKSIICVADRYQGEGTKGRRDEGTKEDEPRRADARSRSSLDGETSTCPGDHPRGKIARYARGDDYHIVMRRRLRRLSDALARQFPDETFRVCVDTAPILEREFAQRAGLGAVGKHTLLIEPGVGSWLLLGQIITTLELVPCEPCETDPCGTCTRCIDACPTDAITPFSVDATRCISSLTIEHRSAIDERYHEAMGQWIFGCDICQEVCPHNQSTQRSRAAPVHDSYAPRRDSLDLLVVLNWDEQARREAFVRSAMKRAKLSMMKRNALIAAGNCLVQTNDPALRRRVTTIADDPAEGDQVRSTARTILAKLADARAGLGRKP